MEVADFLFHENISHYMNLASSIAEICALAIANSRKYYRLEIKNRQQLLFTQIFEIFLQAHGLNREIKDLLKLLKEYSEVDFIRIRIKQDRGYPSLGHIGKIPPSIGIEEYENLCLSVVKGTQKGDRENFSENGSYFHSIQIDRHKYNTVIIIPLKKENNSLGLIEFFDSRINHLTFLDVLFLEKVCKSIGIILNHQKLEAEKMLAQSRNKAKSELIANISHEIRTPLNAILGHSDLISLDSIPEKEKKSLQTIKLASQNLYMIISDILDLSKLEAKKMTLQYKYIHIRKLVDNLHIFFKKSLNNKKLGFNIKIGQSVPELLYFDEMKLFQILSNLVSNAINFTEEGGVSILISETNKNTTKNQVSIKMEVSDTGVGIPEEDLDLIFQEFHQRTFQDRRKYGGTGLGLSIAHQYVKKMKGNISVKSDIDKGSVFSLVFPEVKYKSVKNISMGEIQESSILTEMQFPVFPAEEGPGYTEEKLQEIINGKYSHKFIQAIRERFLHRTNLFTGAVIVKDIAQFTEDFQQFCMKNDHYEFDFLLQGLLSAVHDFDLIRIKVISKDIQKIFNEIIKGEELYE